MAKNILIIEDDNFVRELYQHEFEREGYGVRTAEDGQIGLGMALEGGFDCVLLDVMLPKMDGLDVLQKYKDKYKEKGPPVIVLSNLGQDDIIKKALNLGAKAYIVKSLYTPEQVVSEIRNIIGE